MSDKHHLLIPGAAGPGQPPPRPHLDALLAAMEPAGRIEVGKDDPSSPRELAVARAIGLPGEAGHIPWAAHETGTYGAACAWIQPCHWRVGADHVLLLPLEDLALDEATSRALLAAMEPYFTEDGITLAYRRPGAWLATGALFANLPTVSPDRATGMRLTPAAFGAGNATLRRLQNEMQMLLYTHAANEAREARGLPPVNSFWVSGAGVLERPIPPAPGVQVESRLATGAARTDPAAHAQAWAEVDADTCAALLAQLEAGGDVQLTLCGERAAQSFTPAHGGFLRRIKNVLGLQPRWDMNSSL